MSLLTATAAKPLRRSYREQPGYPGPLLLSKEPAGRGVHSHVTYNQSTQEGQNESNGTISLSHNVFPYFPYSPPL